MTRVIDGNNQGNYGQWLILNYFNGFIRLVFSLAIGSWFMLTGFD